MTALVVGAEKLLCTSEAGFGSGVPMCLTSDTGVKAKVAEKDVCPVEPSVLLRDEHGDSPESTRVDTSDSLPDESPVELPDVPALNSLHLAGMCTSSDSTCY